jgi:hypothetical protein
MCSGPQPDFSGWRHYLDLVRSGGKKRLDAMMLAAFGADKHGDGDVRVVDGCESGVLSTAD